MLKHMPKDSLETYEKTLLCSKQKVRALTNQDRRLHNNGTIGEVTDEKLTERITKTSYQIGEDHIHRIPQRYLANIEFVNFLLKNLKLSKI